MPFHLTDCNLSAPALFVPDSSPASSVARSGCSNRLQWLSIAAALDSDPLRPLFLHARRVGRLHAARAAAEAQAQRASAAAREGSL